MTHYGQQSSALKTSPTERARVSQVENNAGGFVFSVGPWTQLDRFLVLGQIGGTYYATERKVVAENAEVIKRCLVEDGARVVRRIVEISDSGRAPKNDPAIFALAMAAGATDIATRRAALAALPKVCRIGTHLFHFAADVAGQRRWGRGLRSAIAAWYTSRSEDDLAMQALKYQQRDGWSHRDLLRLAHPVAKTPGMDATFRWMVGAPLDVDRKRGKAMPAESLHALLAAFGELHAAKDVETVVRLLTTHRLPREAVPTEWLNDARVWEALLPHMGLTAMIRNLGKMTAVGLIKPMSTASKLVCSMLTNPIAIRSGRVHPMAFLLAQGVYRKGSGVKGSLTWTPDRAIVDALDAGFYLAFKSIEPTGKNTLIALDVSGSMDCGEIAGAPGITPRIASAAMAMVTARAEANWHMLGFSHHLVPVDIEKTDSLGTVCQKMSRIPMGGTDCTLPMQYAAGEGLEVDVFQVYTDSETYMGNMHPFEALKAYRAKSGRAARLAVVGLVASNFTVADPSDAGMLDVVGFDSHAPSLLADFARGAM